MRDGSELASPAVPGAVSVTAPPTDGAPPPDPQRSPQEPPNARSGDRTTPSPPEASGGDRTVPEPDVRPLGPVRSVRKLRAWMVVLPVDTLALLTPLASMPGHYKGFLAMAALSLLLLSNGGLYRARLHVSVLDELPVIMSRLLAACAIVATVFAFRHEEIAVTVFLSSALLGMAAVVLGRVLTSQLILLGRRRRIVAHRTVIIGGGVQAAELTILLERYPQYGLFPVGFVDDVHECVTNARFTRLGSVDDLEKVVQNTSSDVIIIADSAASEEDLEEVVRRPGCDRCDLMIVPRMRQFYAHGVFTDHIGAIPVVRLRKPGLSGPSCFVKRVVDILVSATLLVALAPVFAACALAVRLEGGPGVLFRQERVGRGGGLFTCVKFRSMKPASSEESASRWSIAGDHRVGPIGSFLRRTSLDELPQLWNIFRGDMTLIGPRPERPLFVERFAEEVPRYAHRHRVPAGLTGLAQVSGLRGDVPIADRARFDNYYIENWSLWLDVKVLLRTFAEVFFARGR